VQSFPAPSVAAAPTHLRRRALAALVLAAALATAGLLLGHTSSSSGPPHYAGTIGGVPLQQARCAQWSAGTAAERRNTLDALARIVGGPTPYGPATRLTNAEATALFDRACASPIARGFLLYEIYIRAAGYRSYLP